VQKWQIDDITSVDLDKSKHVLIEVGGTAATSLHFHTGSKDTAEEILAKLESSRSLTRESTDSAAALGAEAERQTQPEAEPSPTPAPVQRTLPPPLRTDGAHSPGKKGVHFSEASPAIIPPRAPSPPEQEEEQAQHEEVEGLEAYALYDFQAQGDDELTVAEGDALWIIEQDGDEWWKCRNVQGDEGVVPASYIEVTSHPSSLTTEGLQPTGVGRLPQVVEPEPEEDDGGAEHEAEERAAAERAKQEAKEARERKDREDREQRAKAAAMAAEADRKRKEKEKREREEREREREERARREKERAEEAEEEDRRMASEKKSSKAKAARSSKSTSDSRKSVEKRASLYFSLGFILTFSIRCSP
jgi:actin cytoskeleton-regulatory complex protein SLA1